MKTLKQFTEGTGYLKVKSPDEQKFVDKHKTETIPDANGNGDEVFKASNVKKVPRKAERKGYEPGEDEEVYEAMDAKARYLQHHGHAKDLLKSINDHLKKHHEDSHKYKDYKGRKGPSWSHAEGLGRVVRQLSDIHDQLARQGEYSMHEEVDLDEKKLTPAEMKKREEVAKAIERDNPKMPMSKKMAIATSTAKKVAEQADQIDEMSSKMKMKLGLYGKKKKSVKEEADRLIQRYSEFKESIEGLSPRLQEAMLDVHDRLNEENRDKFVAACQTEEGLEKMVAFALENRGE